MLSVLHFITHQWLLLLKKKRNRNKIHKNVFLKNSVSTVSQHILKQSIFSTYIFNFRYQIYPEKIFKFFLNPDILANMSSYKCIREKKIIISFTSAILTKKRKKRKRFKKVFLLCFQQFWQTNYRRSDSTEITD